MKLRMNKQNKTDFRLVAGTDYAVKDEGGEDWIAYTDPNTNHFRHTWIITKRKRPVAPIFIGSPIPLKNQDAVERSAMLTMAYFHPWTTRENDGQSKHVPYAGNMRDLESGTWEESLKVWLNGNVISEESIRYISNFLCVYRVRPTDPSEDVRSDEDVSDEELQLTAEDLEEVLKPELAVKI